MPCGIQRKLFPLDLDQSCELQGMTCCTDEFPVATTACTRPVKVQARQNGSMEKRGRLEVLPLAKELLQVIAAWKVTVSLLHGCVPGSVDKAPVNATHPRAHKQQKLHLNIKNHCQPKTIFREVKGPTMCPIAFLQFAI